MTAITVAVCLCPNKLCDCNCVDKHLLSAETASCRVLIVLLQLWAK